MRMRRRVSAVELCVTVPRSHRTTVVGPGAEQPLELRLRRPEPIAKRLHFARGEESVLAPDLVRPSLESVRLPREKERFPAPGASHELALDRDRRLADEDFARFAHG